MSKYKKPVLLLSAIVLTLIVLCVTGLIPLAYPNRNTYPVRGIDVSHHQGEINWEQVSKDDVRFAFIKATEADDLKDRLYKVNIKDAGNAGIITGAYHFYSLAYPGEVQARNFIEVVATSSIQLPPAIDLEYVGNSKKRPSREEFQKELNIFIDLLEKNYNKKPIIYTTYKFYNDYLYPEFKDYDLWIRDLFVKPNKIVNDSWVFWQYYSRGNVNGINGPVDLNVFKLEEKYLAN